MNVSPLIYYFMKPHNVWMTKIRECIDFIMHSVLCVFLSQILLIISFESDYCLCFLVHSSSDYCKSALPDLKINLEILQV